MPGRILVTGGSGFVGGRVIGELLERGYGVHALVNRKPLAIEHERLTLVAGGLFDAAAIERGMAGCDGVIHLVGIIRERPGDGITFERMHFDGTRNVVDAARKAGVRRYVQMSALGVRPGAVSEYHRSKYRAEEYVRKSGLDWTIFRPSLIHGPGGEFMAMEAKWARGKGAPFFFMPYFGAGPLGRGGAGLLQPVDGKDVARAFVDALEKPETIGEVYPLGGTQVLTWPEMHRAVARAITGKPRAVGAIPVWYARLLTKISPAFLLPFNEDQIIMSQEDNTCDLGKFERDFGWRPGGFEESLRAYAPSL